MLQVNYEASGWVAHQVSDIWAKTSPDRGEAVWALWPMGGAWLCTHLWEHYTFTMDKVRFYTGLSFCFPVLFNIILLQRTNFFSTPSIPNSESTIPILGGPN